MNNKRYERTITGLVVCAILLTTGAFAAVLGELINSHDTFLGAGMELSKGVYWTGSDYRTENYIEYNPSEGIYPVVVSGSKVCNYGDFKSMAALLEKEGKHVIAGINGDYFVMANFEPLGIVLQDGKLLSSDAGLGAVGFKKDGSAIFGKPGIQIGVDIGGQAFSIDSLNKTRRAGGTVLYTDDFAAKTKNSDSGTEIICAISSDLNMNSLASLTVEEIRKDSGAISIPAGKAIISVSSKANKELVAAIGNLKVGDKLPLNISTASEWANVNYAIGSLYKLVTGGVVEKGLEAGTAPRSAVGMKADGSLVFYTMDGRQTGHSVGVTMTMLAQRMVELGCTEAAIMDGGGSTSMNAIYIGDSSASQINKPSEGYQRAVTNYIMLVTDKKPIGTASRLALYPLSTHIMAGADTNFVLKAADENGYAAKINSAATLAVSDGLGTIKPSGSFTAAGEGKGTITADAAGMMGAAVQITVVKSPDILRVFREGSSSAVSLLDVKAGVKTDLYAGAMDNYVNLIAQDKCFTWAVEGNIGTIDNLGTFVAGNESAQGSIIVSAGDTVVKIPVTVTNPEKFDDVSKGSWYYDAVTYVSERGLMEGVEPRIFAPEASATRAMSVTILHRLAGSPEPTGSNNAFADVSGSAWYVKPVYWANNVGIVEGYDGIFNPNGAVTREQLATILYRHAGSPATSGALEKFLDEAAVATWARPAMTWAVERGLITGIDDQHLQPQGTATRAQLATILQRMGT